MSTNTTKTVVGIDLGDKMSVICVLNAAGEKVKECQVATTQTELARFFVSLRELGPLLVALETGTHSPWVSALLAEQGMEVLVGNARKLRAIWESTNKSDVKDAEMLARLARFDRNLLSPIQHRSRQAQMDLAILKARDALVSARTDLVNMVRGLAKAAGVRLPECGTEVFDKAAITAMPKDLLPAVTELLTTIRHLTAQIHRYDHQLERLSAERYLTETERLRQISGVGVLTALAFILTLESSERFARSRDVGAFLGLVPKRDQSGETDKPLSITKTGNEYLRRLLIGSANYILGPFGPDCDLRRAGERMAGSGGKIARRKAKVAVARKLAVLLHSLWKSGQVDEPLRKKAVRQPAVAA